MNRLTGAGAFTGALRNIALRREEGVPSMPGMLEVPEKVCSAATWSA